MARTVCKYCLTSCWPHHIPLTPPPPPPAWGRWRPGRPCPCPAGGGRRPPGRGLDCYVGRQEATHSTPGPRPVGHSEPAVVRISQGYSAT